MQASTHDFLSGRHAVDRRHVLTPMCTRDSSGADTDRNDNKQSACCTLGTPEPDDSKQQSHIGVALILQTTAVVRMRSVVRISIAFQTATGGVSIENTVRSDVPHDV